MLSFKQYCMYHGSLLRFALRKEALLCLIKFVDPCYVDQAWILHSEATVQYESNKISHLNKIL